uniref:Uncharacterized protein n=1 Tax=Rhodopseudomonas palustris (strain BisA53) TaxID=316055 RepID=Q07KC3_RHOP5
MSFDGWDKTSDGGVILNPLCRIETAPLPHGVAGVLRIVYLTGGPNDETAAVQLVVAYQGVVRLINELQILHQMLTDNLPVEGQAGEPGEAAGNGNMPKTHNPSANGD